mgnify:CR=1 FL=1
MAIAAALLSFGVELAATHAISGVSEALTVFMPLKLVLYLTVIVTLFYARPYVLQRPDLRRGEFYLLVFFATLGMMVMISSGHFLSLYLGL